MPQGIQIKKVTQRYIFLKVNIPNGSFYLNRTKQIKTNTKGVKHGNKNQKNRTA
jgi:hypothetical protein